MYLLIYQDNIKLLVFRILYTSNDKMMERVDIKLDNVIDEKKSTVLKNISSSVDKYQDIATGE